VDHVDLTVPPGSLFGLVGPNGAGKTTSLSMAVGLLRPDGGSARIFGVDVWADPVRAKRLIGVLPDGMAMPERLTGRELLTYLGLLRGLDPPTVAGRAQELLEVLEVLELTEAERTVVIDYSAGMRKKITLATALLHTPRRQPGQQRSETIHQARAPGRAPLVPLEACVHGEHPQEPVARPTPGEQLGHALQQLDDLGGERPPGPGEPPAAGPAQHGAEERHGDARGEQGGAEHAGGGGQDPGRDPDGKAACQQRHQRRGEHRR
jgi:ABC transporter